MIRRLLLIAAMLGGLGRAPGPPAEPCTVTRIVDGDTFYCDDTLKVRLIGIDAPERGQGEPGAAAAAALRRLMPRGAVVRLERDVTLTDRYGRRLAYVWRGDTLVNEAMVRGGWAILYTVPPNVKYVDRLERAQRAARHARAGLWNTWRFVCPPASWRRRRC